MSKKKGSLSSHWKGGWRIDNHGYVRIWTGKAYILEHRVVMEYYLKRELKDSEIVHHINGNRRDNRIENLMIVTRASHKSGDMAYIKICCPYCKNMLGIRQ